MRRIRTRSTESPAGEFTATSGGSSRWEFLRVGLAVLYLLGALVHLALGALAPGVYLQFVNQALIPAYADLWRSLVVPSLGVLQPLVVAFEFGVALALCWRGRVVLFGHVAGALFQVGLVLSGPWGAINAGLALIHLAALRQSYPVTVGAFVRQSSKEA